MIQWRKFAARTLRILAYLAGALILLFLILILLLRTPWAQNKLAGEVTRYFSQKTGTELNIKHIFLTFSGNIRIEGLYATDLNGDTLVYFQSLEGGLKVLPAIRGKYHLAPLHWQGAVVNLKRYADSSYNFDFIAAAFSNDNSSAAGKSESSENSEPFVLLPGPVHLSQVKMYYLDSIAGQEITLDLGKLDLAFQHFDIQNAIYGIDQLELAETQVNFWQFADIPTTDTSSSDLPEISWNEISLKNVDAGYHSPGNISTLQTHLGQFKVQSSRLRLDANQVQLGKLILQNSEVNLRLAAAEESADTTAPDDSPPEFTWPAWEISLEGIFLDNNTVRYSSGTPLNEDLATFDPNHMEFSDLRFHLGASSYNPKELNLLLQDFSFKENSGFHLDGLSFQSTTSDTGIAIRDFSLTTAHSTLFAALTLQYSQLKRFMADPLNSIVALNIDEQSSLSLKDAFYFSENLAGDSLMQSIAAYPFSPEGRIEGKLEDFILSEVRVGFLQNSQLEVSGNIRGLPDTSGLFVSLPMIRLRTIPADLALFADISRYQLQDDLNLQASIEGDLNEVNGELSLKSELGGIEGQITGRHLTAVPLFSGQFTIQQLKAGLLTDGAVTEPVSFELHFQGSGNSLENLVTDVKVDFQELTYRGYPYPKLRLAATFNRGDFSLDASHRDENLNFNMALNGALDSSFAQASLQLELAGADLGDLNLYPGRFKTAFDFSADYSGSPNDFSLQTQWQNALFIRGETSYRLDSVYAFLKSSDEESTFSIHSEILEGRATWNQSIAKMSEELQAYLSRLVSREEPSWSGSYSDLDLAGDFTITASPILSEIFLPELSQMDSIHFSARFRPADTLLNLALMAPALVYNNFDLANFKILLSSHRDITRAQLSFDHLIREPVSIGKTAFALNMSEDQGMLQLEMLDQKGDPYYSLRADLERRREYLGLHLLPEGLILHSDSWQIPAGNEIIMASEDLIIKNFVLQNAGESLELASARDTNELQIIFSDFDLNRVFGLINNQKDILSGKLQGEIKILDIYDTPGLLADITLNQLSVFDQALGQMILKGGNTSSNEFGLDLKLQGPNLEFKANGQYSTKASDASIEMELNLIYLKLPLVEALFPDYIDSSKGTIHSRISLSGALNHPEISGTVGFDNASFQPKALGAYYHLANEEITFTRTDLQFKDFTIQDGGGNKAQISGAIGMADMLNPSFDLKLTARNFQLLEAQPGENELYYGTAVADLDIDLGGSLNLPVINSQVTVRDETDITYTVPASQAQIESAEGTVRFRNMRDSLDVLSAGEEEQSQLILGYDIQSEIKLQRGTRFKMILDPRSGDNLSISGEADLNFSLSPNGNMSLTGSYELQDGGYRLNLYEVVKKEFAIKKGSLITWDGDPMKARLDITAIYNSRTSAANLMDNPDPMYNRELPFQVILYIKGNLENPEISFALDMPEDSKGALSGSVYRKVMETNSNESEMNKQVFALVVFDRFIPSSKSGDAGVSSSDIARSSVSNFLSGQLNQLSQKYLKGVELGVNIESYTDYSGASGEERTDVNLSLRKAFFNDRMVVEVGSNVGVEGSERGNEVIGDLALEYLLTEDGTYRLRGYRRNDYDNPIEGEVIITGLGLIFSRDFDSWDDLFKKREEDREKKDIPSEGSPKPREN